MNWKVLGIVLWKITKLCFKVALVFLQFTVQFMNDSDKRSRPRYTPLQAMEKRRTGSISVDDYNEAINGDKS